MCFSASVSFILSAVLIPRGIYCIKTAIAKNIEYLPMACSPLAFGIQQGLEGILWLGIGAGNPNFVAIGSLGFLFFSHWFWLFWIPFLAFVLERDRVLKNISLLFVIVGLLYGASLYFPLLIHENWLSIQTIHHSIDYQTRLIFDPFVSRELVRLLYASLILLPLLISSHQSVKVFGFLILLSVIVAVLRFYYAFISVWCFFAALLSLYLAYVMYRIDAIAMSSCYKASELNL
ncbi:MAG: hypothetical protein IGR93_09760 [Hydrococcus sp. C42_A2020_068]|nr:hypothetical protein [Hydrococcus sp. C42_A2020_068]